MSDEDFISYVGDYRIHDSKILDVISGDKTLQVSLKTEMDEVITVKFLNTVSVDSCKPIGMFLYAIAEMKAEGSFRKFVFINWNEEDDAYLEVISSDLKILE